MIKVRMKRVKTGKCFNPGELDRRFVEGNLKVMPKKGGRLLFYFNRFDRSWWLTSIVTKITKRKTLASVKTRNSTYHIKRGWKK